MPAVPRPHDRVEDRSAVPAEPRGARPAVTWTKVRAEGHRAFVTRIREGAVAEVTIVAMRVTLIPVGLTFRGGLDAGWGHLDLLPWNAVLPEEVATPDAEPGL